MTNHASPHSTLDGSRKRSALIIGGAAGKGPFAAGALSVLARDPRFDVKAVMGASSGALNAAVYAAGLRAGDAAGAADHLCDLWRTEASWFHIFTHAQRVEIVKGALQRFRGAQRSSSVALDVVVATLRGTRDVFNQLRFEQLYKFSASDFETAEGIQKIAEVCVLSATIPVVFPPRRYGNAGQFWDGGIVNNTPLGNTLKRDAAIDHMLVVASDSEAVDVGKRYWRFSVSRLLEMVIDERLARDLCDAKTFNGELAALCRAGIDLKKLEPAVSWKLLQFLEIRPGVELRGNVLSGFFSGKTRREYVAIGERAAKKQLAEWTPQVFDTGVRPGTPCPCGSGVQHGVEAVSGRHSLS